MVDNLPLIPQKSNVLCTDVRPVLREVFKDRDSMAPLATEALDPEHRPSTGRDWVQEYALECENLCKEEKELKKDQAKRLSRRMRNIYQLSSPKSSHSEIPAWVSKRGIIKRKDLVPLVDQKSGCNSLWVRNILKSSTDVSSKEYLGFLLHPGDESSLSTANSCTNQSLSFGEVPLPRRTAPPRPPREPSPPVSIVCYPLRLDFVDFTVGKVYAKSVRLMNTTTSELRLSLKPPGARALSVQVDRTRGLAVTARAAATLRVRFQPTEYREISDQIVVRVTMGKTVVVPVHCYMAPPTLRGEHFVTTRIFNTYLLFTICRSGGIILNYGQSFRRANRAVSPDIRATGFGLGVGFYS
ncbi:hypothetical protein ACJJTC_008341 [Scirpophaga incertulas]